MNISAHDFPALRATSVSVSADTLTVELADGRTLSVPLAWYPRLLHSSPERRQHWRLIGAGTGIHWPDIEEDISIEGLVLGQPSREAQSSFSRWLAAREPQ